MLEAGPWLNAFPLIICESPSQGVLQGASRCSRTSHTIVGMSWHTNDERKMVDTFGVGRSMFENFVDVVTVAKELGYRPCGLVSLADSVLNVTLSKSKEASPPSSPGSQRLGCAAVLCTALYCDDSDDLICTPHWHVAIC